MSRKPRIADPLLPPRGFQEATGKPRRYVHSDDSTDYVLLITFADWCRAVVARFRHFMLK